MLTSLALFDFSKIKSDYVFQISEYNSFYYHFSESESYSAKNGDMPSLKEDPSKYYIKNVNMTIPSNEKLKEEYFRNDFFINYDTSFANFCGLSEKMFTEIYDKSQYIPEVNQMGDIIINIDKIIKNIDEFSQYKRLKIQRRIIKRNKKGKIKEKNDNLILKKSLNILLTAKSESNSNCEDIISLEENNLNNISKSNDIKSQRKNENKSQMNSSKSISNSNDESVSKDGNIANKPKDRTLLNIKRKLKNISIIKKNEAPIKEIIKNEQIESSSSNISSEKNFNEKNKSYVLNNSLILSNDNPLKSSKPLESSNFNKNNVFNFSSNAIKDLSNNSRKNENPNYPIITPVNNLEPNNNVGGNINLNLFQNNFIFSPFPFPHQRFSSFLSPNLSVNSPNNNNLFKETFNFINNDANDDEEEQNNNNTNIIDDDVNLSDKHKMKNNNEKNTNY